ncbi:MAG: hypothetical protein GXO26_07710, partial [Crenarchaeota archaeon]|nr:hypothetical protein [Thermoproteota archaeon]
MNEENLFLLGDYLSDPIIRLLAKLCVFKKRTSTRLAKIRQPSTGDDIGVIRKASKSILYTSILLSFPIPVKLHHRILWQPQSALEIDNEIPITKDIQDASTGIIYNILGDIDESILAEYIGEDNVEKLSESGYRILALTIKLLESYRYSLPENIIELLENFIRNYAKLNMKYRTQYLEAGRIIASLVGLAGYIYNNEINP